MATNNAFMIWATEVYNLLKKAGICTPLDFIVNSEEWQADFIDGVSAKEAADAVACIF